MRARLLLPLALIWATPAAAHPEHYEQAAYVTLGRDRVTLQLELSAGPLVASRVVRAIDANGDLEFSKEEERAYTNALLREVSLEVDGQALTPTLSSARFPPASHLMTGEDQLRFTFTAALPRLGVGQHRAVFRNNHRLVQSSYSAHAFPGGREVVVGKQTRDTPQQQLRVDYEVKPPAPGNPVTWPDARSTAVALGLVALAGLGGAMHRARNVARSHLLRRDAMPVRRVPARRSGESAAGTPCARCPWDRMPPAR